MYPAVLLGQRHVFFSFVSISPPTGTLWPTQESRKGGTTHTEPGGPAGRGSQEGHVAQACPPSAIRAQPQGQESEPNCKS